MAQIKELSGKYYGTVVVLKDGSWITIWVPDDHNLKLSQREIDRGNTFFEDNHMEDARSYKIAQLLCEAINTSGIEEPNND